MAAPIGEQAERARLARKAAKEDEAAAQLAVSVHKSSDEQLEDMKLEYASKGMPVVFFLKLTNPMVMKYKGKIINYSMNESRADIFALQLDGCHGNTERITHYEKKGWRIVGHVNLPTTFDDKTTEGMKDVVAHIRIIENYTRNDFVEEAKVRQRPEVGTKKKLASKQFDQHEEIVPRPVNPREKELKESLSQLENEVGGGVEDIDVVETKVGGRQVHV